MNHLLGLDERCTSVPPGKCNGSICAVMAMRSIAIITVATCSSLRWPCLQVTYVSMQFCAVRPDSMAIYKSVDFGRTWTPYQFYSGDCWRVYRRSPRAVVTRTNEQQALCTDVYSGAAESAAAAAGPGSRIAFSTLEGRPSAHDFDHSPVLQVTLHHGLLLNGE